MADMSPIGNLLQPNCLLIQTGYTYQTTKNNKTKQTKNRLLLANWNYYSFK